MSEPKYVNLVTVSTAWLSIWTVLGATPVPIFWIFVLCQFVWRSITPADASKFRKTVPFRWIISIKDCVISVVDVGEMEVANIDSKTTRTVSHEPINCRAKELHHNPAKTSRPSSAVAKRLRDGSCQSVVSSIEQNVEQSFIISYFGFRFTSAYNSIPFCCLRRNAVTSSLAVIHTIHGRPWLLSAVALGRPIPAVKKTPAAKCDKLTTVQ